MRLYILVLFCLSHVFHINAVASGGEIGNAFVPYTNYIGRYSLEYPSGWRFTDLSNVASFSDPLAPSLIEVSFFSVTSNRFPEVNALKGLELHLATVYPNESWDETDIAGLSGYKNTRSPHMIFLLRAPGDVLSIHFHAADSSKEKLIQWMLKTFTVK